MFVGLVTLEDTLVGTLLTRTTGLVPINADALPTFRTYGPNGFVKSGTCSFRNSASLTLATNANPIVITSTDHGLTTGAYVTITGVTGNTAANGTFLITKIGDNTFSLDSSTGNGEYVDGGTWNVAGLYAYSIPAQGVDDYEKGEVYQVNFTYALSSTVQGQAHYFQVS